MQEFQLGSIGSGGIHMIGIGGISMSALAELMIHRGIRVTGSDMKGGASVDRLRSLGCTVGVPHGVEWLGTPELVVYTAAIPETNPELAEARRLGLRCMERAEMLGLLMREYPESVAVSGTHGKTTTTSMIASVLLEAEMNPTVHVGGLLDRIGGNLRIGSHDLFVTEACEYKSSFLQFHPTLAVVLNVDADHLDWFRDLDHIESCFAEFLGQVPAGGCIVLNADDPGCMEVLRRIRTGNARAEDGASVDASAAATDATAADSPSGALPKRHTAAGADILLVSAEGREADLHAADIRWENGLASFDLVAGGERWCRARLSVPGAHNIANAVCAAAACRRLGVSGEAFAKGLLAFRGTHRRFERKGEFRGAAVIDDYAHHPAEITATLKAARAVADGRITCVFQPHTYTRTHELFDAFAHAFGDCDEVIVADIYAAREPDTGLVHASTLAEAIGRVSGNAVYAGSLDAAVSLLKGRESAGAMILTMGAGDVVRVAEELVGG